MKTTQEIQNEISALSAETLIAIGVSKDGSRIAGNARPTLQDRQVWDRVLQLKTVLGTDTLSSALIAESMSLSAAEVRDSLQYLSRIGALTTEGEKRATRYRVAAGEDFVLETEVTVPEPRKPRKPRAKLEAVPESTRELAPKRPKKVTRK